MRLRAITLACALVASLSALAEPPGYAIRVKGVEGDTVLQLVPTAAGGMVRADVMARLLGGTLDSLGEGRWRLGLYGTSLDLAEGAPFASYNGFTLPLLEPTRVIDGAAHVTLQLFSEIIPRFGIGILWDRSRSEVRLFQGIARRSAPNTPFAVPAATATPVSVASNVGTGPGARDSGSPAPTGSAAATADSESAGANTPPSRTPAAASGLPSGKGAAANRLSRRYTVVVDAGHGGRDPGMPGVLIGGRSVPESRITLAVASRLERMLREKGIAVLMTRTSDTLIGLYDRGPMANRAKGDLFISVHVNGANPKWKNPASVRGFETFYLSTARTEDEAHVARMENEVVHFETQAEAPKGDPLAFILNDLARNEHLRESSELASAVQAKLALSHPGPNRGVKQGGLVVLSTAYMPAVLVEIGYGSNPAEARWLLSDKGQEDAARAVADAAFEYLLHYDRRALTSKR
jgi:N-acetylmuramoyl-L-alanine amidase